MIKEVFELKKNSWHVKLMKSIWNLNYTDFRNMCPYFWLTILNIVIFPFWVLFKICIGLFNTANQMLNPLFDKWDAYCAEKIDKWYNEKLLKIDDTKEIINDRDFYRIYRYYDTSDTYLTKKQKKLYNKLPYDKFDTIIDTFRKEEIKKEEKEEVKTNVQLINKLAKIGKYVAYSLASIISLGLLYLVYLGILFLIGIDWANVLINFLAAIFILSGIVVIVFSCYLIGKAIAYLFCTYGTYCIPCESRREKIGNFFNLIGQGFVVIGKGFVFIWQVLVELKKNHCPGIEWKD